MSSNHDYDKGKIDFEKRFVEKIKKDRNIDISIDKWDDFNTKFRVVINGKIIVIKYDHGNMEDFGGSGPESSRIIFVNTKVKEFIDEYNSP